MSKLTKLFFCVFIMIIFNCNDTENENEEFYPCEDRWDCQDNVYCTIDTCIKGECYHFEDDFRCAETHYCKPMYGCAPWDEIYTPETEY